jgi:subtilisin family serine protease
MKNLRPLLFPMLLVLFSFSVLLNSCQKEQNVISVSTDLSNEEFSSELIENQYIVTLNEEAIGYPLRLKKGNPVQLSQMIFDIAQDLYAKYPDFTIDRSIDYVYTHSIVGFSGSMSVETAIKLSQDPLVKAVEQDQIVSLGKGKPRGGTSQPTQAVPLGITRVNGTTYSGENVAWIIDTGIDTDHPDLNVDASKGFSAFTRGKDAGTDDGHGHGTHVAGTVAAIDNLIGVVGVAAGATVIPVKVLSSTGSGSNSGVIAGVDWVAKYGVSGDVANMSLGGSVSSALDDAVLLASKANGVKFCLAAGNESNDANNSSPARVNGDYVYTISAMNASNDVFAGFSNFGNPPIDYAAPGVNIYSCYKGGGYATMSGTSMASPHAAGVLLLGSPSSGGTVNGDPDGNADIIITH